MLQQFVIWHHFVNWISDTRASSVVRDVTWIIPLVQTIHILAICAVVSAMLLLHLRSFRLALRNDPQADVARRFLPVIWYGVLILLVSGVILIIGEPSRELLNDVFQLKMLLLVMALALTALYQRFLRQGPLYWDQTAGRRTAVMALSAVSLAVWIGIVFAGRWIAYAAS